MDMNFLQLISQEQTSTYQDNDVVLRHRSPSPILDEKEEGRRRESMLNDSYLKQMQYENSISELKPNKAISNFNFAFNNPTVMAHRYFRSQERSATIPLSYDLFIGQSKEECERNRGNRKNPNYTTLKRKVYFPNGERRVLNVETNFNREVYVTENEKRVKKELEEVECDYGNIQVEEKLFHFPKLLETGEVVYNMKEEGQLIKEEKEEELKKKPKKYKYTLYDYDYGIEVTEPIEEIIADKPQGEVNSHERLIERYEENKIIDNGNSNDYMDIRVKEDEEEIIEEIIIEQSNNIGKELSLKNEEVEIMDFTKMDEIINSNLNSEIVMDQHNTKIDPTTTNKNEVNIFKEELYRSVSLKNGNGLYQLDEIGHSKIQALCDLKNNTTIKTKLIRERQTDVIRNINRCNQLVTQEYADSDLKLEGWDYLNKQVAACLKIEANERPDLDYDSEISSDEEEIIMERKPINEVIQQQMGKDGPSLIKSDEEEHDIEEENFNWIDFHNPKKGFDTSVQFNKNNGDSRLEHLLREFNNDNLQADKLVKLNRILTDTFGPRVIAKKHELEQLPEFFRNYAWTSERPRLYDVKDCSIQNKFKQQNESYNGKVAPEINNIIQEEMIFQLFPEVKELRKQADNMECLENGIKRKRDLDLVPKLKMNTKSIEKTRLQNYRAMDMELFYLKPDTDPSEVRTLICNKKLYRIRMENRTSNTPDKHKISDKHAPRNYKRPKLAMNNVNNKKNQLMEGNLKYGVALEDPIHVNTIEDNVGLVRVTKHLDDIYMPLGELPFEYFKSNEELWRSNTNTHLEDEFRGVFN